jgi:DNA polymerase III subunit delta
MNVLLYGNEPYLMNEALRDLLKRLVGTPDAMNTITEDFTASSFSMQRFLDEANTMSFFSDHKVMILQNCVFLTRSYFDKQNKFENDRELLMAYLSQPHDQTSLIFLYNDDNLDTAKATTKHLKATCDVIHVKKLEPDQFRQFLRQQLDARKLKINSDGFDELAKRLDDNMQVALHECDKLALYGSTITKADVVALVSRPLDSEAFHLVNAIMDKKLSDALSLWNDMILLNIDALAFIGLIASQLRVLYQVSILNDQGLHRSDIINELSQGSTPMNVYRVTRLLNLARQTSSKRLLKVLNALAEYDQKSKTGQIDKRFGFELFLIEATR